MFRIIIVLLMTLNCICWIMPMIGDAFRPTTPNDERWFSLGLVTLIIIIYALFMGLIFEFI